MRWTEEATSMLLRNDGKLTYAEAQRLFNGKYSESCLYKKAKENGITFVNTKRKWTKEEDTWLINNYKKYSVEQLSNILNRTHNAVVYRITQLGGSRRKNKVLTVSDINLLKENSDKYSATDFSKYFNVPTSTIRGIAKRNGVSLKNGHLSRLENKYPELRNIPANYGKPITEELAHKVKKDYWSGKTRKELAEKYGRTLSSIDHILRY